MSVAAVAGVEGHHPGDVPGEYSVAMPTMRKCHPRRSARPVLLDGNLPKEPIPPRIAKLLRRRIARAFSPSVDDFCSARSAVVLTGLLRLGGDGIDPIETEPQETKPSPLTSMRARPDSNLIPTSGDDIPNLGGSGPSADGSDRRYSPSGDRHSRDRHNRHRRQPDRRLVASRSPNIRIATPQGIEVPRGPRPGPEEQRRQEEALQLPEVEPQLRAAQAPASDTGQQPSRR
jgi:hypothetical protein